MFTGCMYTLYKSHPSSLHTFNIRPTDVKQCLFQRKLVHTTVRPFIYRGLLIVYICENMRNFKYE